MDGNGRWAKARQRPRRFGHRAGVETIRRIVEDASEIGIKHLTLYSFSTENWTRPRAEIAALMALMREYIEVDLEQLSREDVRIRILGTREGLPRDVLKMVEKAERQTESNRSFNLNIAFNYGGRNEILRAVQRAIATGENMSDISELQFAKFFDTAGQPDPDVVIRTSGEKRVSNFLLWQAAYAEFVFTDILWPDFNRTHLIAAMDEYTGRNRRFGALDATEVA